MQQSNSRGPLVIYYGTMGGTSASLSYLLANEAKQQDFIPSVINLSEFDESQLSLTKLAIFIVSTYGCGGPTDDADEFWKWMKSTNLNFQNLKYSVFALGSHHMEYFCKMGIFTDETLTRLGAQRVYPLGQGDSADNQTLNQFEQWKTNLWDTLKKEFPLTHSYSEQQPLTPLIVQISNKEPVRDYSNPENYKLKQYLGSLQLKVIEMKELKKNSSFGNSTLYIDLDATNLKYQTAGNIAIYPENSKTNIDQLCSLLNLNQDDVFEIVQNPLIEGRVLKHPFPSPIKVETYLRWQEYYLKLYILASVISQDNQPRDSFMNFQNYVLTRCNVVNQNTCNTNLYQLKLRSSQQGKDDYNKKIQKECYNLITLLQKYSIKGITLQLLFDLFPPINPRFYTIASSSALHPNNIHLIVSQLVLKENQVQDFQYFITEKLGFASTYFSELFTDYQNKKIRAYLQDSSFIMPKNPDVPLLFTSPGAGVAPMRALIQEKHFYLTSNQLDKSPIRGSITLYFGCRTPNEFLLEDEWKVYQSSGALNKLNVIFSREGGQKVMKLTNQYSLQKYIQNAIIEDLVALRDLLVTQKGCIYICGSNDFGKSMRQCIEKMFLEIQKTLSFLVYSAISDLEKGGQIVKEIWG